MKKNDPPKLNPTEAQINQFIQDWEYVKEDLYESYPKKVDTIQSHIRLKHWDRVFDLLCDIGFDEVALALTSD